MLASIGIYAWFWDVPSWAQVVLMVAAAAALLGRSHVAPLCILIWVWSAGIFEELRWEREVFARDRLRLEDWIAATSLLAFLMFAFRLVELPRGAHATSWRPLARLEERRKRMPQVLLFPYSGAALRLAAAPTLAMLILWLVPWGSFRGNELQLHPPFYRAIVFYWCIGLVGLTAGTAFSILRWRRLSPRQGSIYARWVMLHQLRREQAAVERARARRLRRTRGDQR
jgi:hypothetical protein